MDESASAGERSTVPSISPYGSVVAWKISWSFSSPKRERSYSRWWRLGSDEATRAIVRHGLEHRLAQPQSVNCTDGL